MSSSNNDVVNINISDDSDTYNDFYASVSLLLRILSFLFFAAFLLFIVFSAYGSQSGFSYDNLEYIIRNFALTLDEKQEENVYSIKYNPDTSRSFALIDNKLAVSGNMGISVFSSTGRVICSDTFSFRDPIMVTSEKYALVYDAGSYDLVIYNSFTRIHKESFKEPILNVAMAPNSYYAVVTSSNEYTSTVSLYNDDFKLMKRFNKTGFVVNIDMENDIILITTVKSVSNNSMYCIEVFLYNIKEENVIANVETLSSLPLASKISSDGFFIVASDELIVHNLDKQESSIISYKRGCVEDFAFNNNVATVLLNSQLHEISYDLITVDQNGELLYEREIYATVYDVALNGASACIVTDSQIIVAARDFEKNIQLNHVTSDVILLPLGESELYLCLTTEAPLLNIGE